MTWRSQSASFGGSADGATFQRNRDKLKVRANRNLMTLSKEKCEVLLLGEDPCASGRAGNQVVEPTKEQPNSSYSYLKGGYKDSGGEPFLVGAESIRSNGHNLQVRTFMLDIRKSSL